MVSVVASVEVAVAMVVAAMVVSTVAAVVNQRVQWFSTSGEAISAKVEKALWMTRRSQRIRFALTLTHFVLNVMKSTKRLP